MSRDPGGPDWVGILQRAKVWYVSALTVRLKQKVYGLTLVKILIFHIPLNTHHGPLGGKSK